MISLQPQQIEYSVETNAMGTPILNIEGSKYALGRLVTSEGLALAHQLQRLLAPLASGVVQADGQAGTVDMETVILGISMGLNELTPEQFVAFCRQNTSRVQIVLNSKGETGSAAALFDDWFADKLHHLGIIIAHVAVASGALRFFLGLVTAMNTLSPAQKSPSTSPQDSTGS